MCCPLRIVLIGACIQYTRLGRSGSLGHGPRNKLNYTPKEQIDIVLEAYGSLKILQYCILRIILSPQTRPLPGYFRN